MEIHNILTLMSKLTASKYTGDEFFENNLKHVQALDLTSDNRSVYPNQSIRFSYITKTIELLFRLRDCLLMQSDDPCELILSITQCNPVSKCIDFVVSLGLIPCLIPSVWQSFENKHKSIVQFTENISPNMKYEELKFNVNSIFDLIKEPTLKRLIMADHANVLLAGLCQLCLLPIAKPGTKLAIENAIDESRYAELMNEQNTFKTILKKLILMDRDPLVIREIIFLLGLKSAQKHLKLGLGEMFSDLLIQPNGIQTILRVVSDLTSESSQSFRQRGLGEWSTLIHNYYLKSKTKYTNCIVPQLWELLRSNAMFNQHQLRSIAVYCIDLMYKENYSDFMAYFMNPIEQSLKKNTFENDEKANISQCIEILHTLFYDFKNEIWSLNPTLMTPFASTVYNIYTATACGVYYLKSKLEDLVFLILLHFSNSKDHLKLIVFPKHQMEIEYDDNGDNLRINYIEREHQLNLESQVDLILDLMDKRKDSKLMKTMFVTLLEMFIDVPSNEYSIMEKLFIVKAIHHLIDIDDVQKSLSTDPDIVLNLISSILKSIGEDDIIDTQVLSIALMVLGYVLENLNKSNTIQLDCLVGHLSKITVTLDDAMFENMVLEIQQKIKRIKKSCSKQPKKNIRTIDDVLFDIRDPLLPCRAHALIELKKMIETGDKTVLAKKPAILITIQENLKNADSYLYLSAIFTLSAMCSYFPDDILPILCEQYSLPKHYNHSPETRLKIGEVLMKTVRSLNETIPAFKNRLLNTFMAGVRDDDHLVRASSLSNLADVCRLLRFNIGTVIAEIVNCADYTLRYDNAPEPRRAAVLLLQMIIQGADVELLEILSDNIKDIYQMLKFQYQSDKDETTKVHAQVALENLTDIMKTLFLNKK